MTDITPQINFCLEGRGAQPVLKKGYDLGKINSFLRDAYELNARVVGLTRDLRSIRPAYLSTAPPPRRRQGAEDNSFDRARPLTNAVRDEIDAQSKQRLRQLNQAITELKETEAQRLIIAENLALTKRNRSGFGAIGRWAAGGATTAKSPEEEREEAERKTVAVHRESVIYYLQRKLEEAGRVQSEMMEVRLGREVEKSKSVLYKTRLAGGIPYANEEDMPSILPSTAGSQRQQQQQLLLLQPAGLANGVLDDVSPVQPNSDHALRQDQMQEFAEENADLLQHFEDQLDQIKTAERSIAEISQLHGTLMANIELQSENINQLVEDSYLTTENLGKGNKELKKASERRSTAQALFYSTIAFCSFLVVWDLVF